jgi:signal transduction histidine kinase
MHEEQVIGEVGVMSTEKLRWSGLQAEILSQVVSQCAAVLHQAHSYQIAQDSLRNLKLLTELKDDFISSVSYELCNPLTNIRIGVEMIQRLIHSLHGADRQVATSPHRQSLWQKLDQYLQIVREEWQREFDLVSDLLNFQSLESLTGEALPFSQINLKQWLPEIVSRFSEQAVRQGQILSCDIALDLSTLISHEPSLRRIIIELLTNACKHSPPDSWIALKADVQEKSVVIKVTNTGVTIPPDQFHRIFEPFYRLTRHNLWNLSGTGLGLALVKKLVQVLGGEIQVSSQTGETAFTVSLDREQYPATEFR